MKFDVPLNIKRIFRFSFGLLINVCIIFVLVKAFAFAFDFSYDVFATVCKDSGNNKVVAVTIEPDSSIKDVCEVLDDAGVVKNEYALMVKIRIGKYAAKIKPGTYEIAPCYTNDQIIKVITGGKIQEE